MKKIILEKDTVNLEGPKNPFFVGFKTEDEQKNILIKMWNGDFAPVNLAPHYYPTLWHADLAGESVQEVFNKMESCEKVKEEGLSVKEAFVFDSMEEMLLWAAKRD